MGTWSARSISVLLVWGALALLGGCQESPGDEQVCNHDGVCDAPDETIDNCPDDCFVCDYDGCCEEGEIDWVCEDCGSTSCDLTDFNDPPIDVIVQSVYLPEESEDALWNGVDMDGDGVVDNKLGQILTWFATRGVLGDVNPIVDRSISQGDIVLLGRVVTSSCRYMSQMVSVELFPGERLDSPPSFDGSDQVRTHPEAETFPFICAYWEPPRLETGPQSITVSVPLPEVGIWSATVYVAFLRTVDDPDSPFFGNSAVEESGWTNVMFGVGLWEDDIYDDVLPTVAEIMNVRIAEDATGSAAIVDLFDGQCDPSVSGCEEVEAGVGECDNQELPPMITVTELWCNQAFRELLAPDVDTDGDGENDVLSLGFRIASAVPVTIVE